MPSINLKKIIGETVKLGVLAAVFGPAALGLAQCSRDNDYDAWDPRAIKSYGQHVGQNYYWEYRKFIRDPLEAIGGAVPAKNQP